MAYNKRMSFISRYIAYLKRNPEGYWFKRRAYGWGWVPATWQGWLSLAAMLALFGLLLVMHISKPLPMRNPGLFIVEVLVWIAALILLCYLKGEPPKWQWGIPDEEKK